MMPNTISGHAAITTASSPFAKRAFVPGRPVWIITHRAALPLFLRLLVLLDQVEPLKLSNTWSFNYRAPRMGSGVSDHAGWAVDCWSNGIGTHTWPSRMPAAKASQIARILDNFRTVDGRHIFGWGICKCEHQPVPYDGPTYTKHESNDPMHFFIAPGVGVWDLWRAARKMRIRPDGTVKS